MVKTVAAFVLTAFLYLACLPELQASACRQDSRPYVNALKTLGFYQIDHIRDAVNYRNAILRFQCDNNLTADGIAGHRFESAVINRLTINGRYDHPDNVAAPPSEGYWITINQTKRILTLYQGGDVVRKFPVAIGKNTTSTPEGKFSLVIKGKNPVWINPETKERVKGGTAKNPLGYRWLGLSPGKGYKYGIHGNNSPYSIGLEISKGCIRMINSDIRELYDVIPTGTAVWIGKDHTLRKWGVKQPGCF